MSRLQSSRKALHRVEKVQTFLTGLNFTQSLKILGNRSATMKRLTVLVAQSHTPTTSTGATAHILLKQNLYQGTEQGPHPLIGNSTLHLIQLPHSFLLHIYHCFELDHYMEVTNHIHHFNNFPVLFLTSAIHHTQQQAYQKKMNMLDYSRMRAMSLKDLMKWGHPSQCLVVQLLS